MLPYLTLQKNTVVTCDFFDTEFVMNQNAVLCSLLFFAFVLMTGCAGMEQYETGIPAKSSDKFYFHMEKEALDRGFDTDRGELYGLSVTVDGQGSLDYKVQGDGIVVNVQVDDVYDLEKAEIQTRLDALKSLNEAMIDGAVERANRASVFE